VSAWHASLAAQVSGKRWKLDIDSRQDALLMLSAVALPGNVQVHCELQASVLQ